MRLLIILLIFLPAVLSAQIIQEKTASIPVEKAVIDNHKDWKKYWKKIKSESNEKFFHDYDSLFIDFQLKNSGEISITDSFSLISQSLLTHYINALKKVNLAHHIQQNKQYSFLYTYTDEIDDEEDYEGIWLNNNIPETSLGPSTYLYKKKDYPLSFSSYYQKMKCEIEESLASEGLFSLQILRFYLDNGEIEGVKYGLPDYRGSLNDKLMKEIQNGLTNYFENFPEGKYYFEVPFHNRPASDSLHIFNISELKTNIKAEYLIAPIYYNALKLKKEKVKAYADSLAIEFPELNQKKLIIFSDTLSLQKLIKSSKDTFSWKDRQLYIPKACADQLHIVSFPGCPEDFLQPASFSCFNLAIQKHIAENYNYKRELVRKGISGRVYVNFEVNIKSGKVENLKVIRSPHPELSKQAIDVMETLPDMIIDPNYKGKVKHVKYTVPINAKLK